MMSDTSFTADSDILKDLEIESILELPSLPGSPAILDSVGETNVVPPPTVGDSDPIVEDSDTLVAIDGLFDIVQNLPGLYLDTTSQHYHVRGKIDMITREAFYDYAKRIGTLTLGHRSRAKGTISSQILLRLAQLRGPEGSLLPSLHHLHIHGSDGSYLDHLDLFLTPSLMSLEITKIPTNSRRISSIMSFLDNGVEVSPNLESLILGPFAAPPPQGLLDSCMKFRQLQRLELRGVSFSEADRSLKGFGSLKYLNHLILDECRDSVIEAPATEGADKPPLQTIVEPSTASNFGLQSVASDSWGTFMANTIVNTPVSDERTGSSRASNMVLFTSCTVLQIIGTSDLIEKVISSVPSPDLRELSLTFTTIPKEICGMKGKKKARKTLSHVIERWPSLVSAEFTVKTSQTASLPGDTLWGLLCQPELKRLEINGFYIPFMKSALPEPLSEPYSSHLESLHLPINCKSTIPLSWLRYIAISCPRLTSLRCRLDLGGLVPSIDSVTHRLESLVVASDNLNNESPQESSRLLNIAAYIDSLFPDLIKINKVSGLHPLSHECDWLQICEMVKLLKIVRAHERQRLRV